MSMSYAADAALALGWKGMLALTSVHALSMGGLAEERALWIVIVGGGMVGVVMKVLDAVLPRLTKFRRDMVQIDDASHKGRADDCEEREKRLLARIKVQDNEAGRLYVISGKANEAADYYQRIADKRLEDYARLQAVNVALVEESLRLKRLLANELAQYGSSGARPLHIQIDPGSAPVPVVEAHPGEHQGEHQREHGSDHEGGH